MEIPKLNDAVPFLKKCLNASQILAYEPKFLTSPGDNFGSIMLLLTVRYLTSENNNQKTVSLVAKTPILNDSLKLVFKPERTFIKENGFYLDSIPEMLQLQRDAGIPESKLCSNYVRCYGARISVDTNAIEADNDAILLLENLTVSGYQTGDRRVGFSAQFAFQIIEKLAEFHALPIAVRTLRLDKFNKNIRPYLDKWSNDAWDILELSEILVSAIREAEWYKDEEHIRDNFINQIEQLLNTPPSNQIPEDGPFISIQHQDFWVNNMMYKLDSSGETIDTLKILDYQIMQYESVAFDIIFFLFTSVHGPDLDANYDEFLRHYYEHFSQTLKDVGCSLDEYSLDKFLAEVKQKAKFEIVHIMIMMRVLMSRKKSVSDLPEMDNTLFLRKDFVGNGFLERIKNIILLFHKKGLLSA